MDEDKKESMDTAVGGAAADSASPAADGAGQSSAASADKAETTLFVKSGAKKDATAKEDTGAAPAKDEAGADKSAEAAKPEAEAKEDGGLDFNFTNKDFFDKIGQEKTKAVITAMGNLVEGMVNGDDSKVVADVSGFVIDGLQGRPKEAVVEIVKKIISGTFGEAVLQELGVDYKKSSEYLSHLAKIEDAANQKYQKEYTAKEQQLMQEAANKKAVDSWEKEHAALAADAKNYPYAAELKNDMAKIIDAMPDGLQKINENTKLAYEIALRRNPTVAAKIKAEKIKKNPGAKEEKSSGEAGEMQLSNWARSTLSAYKKK